MLDLRRQLDETVDLAVLDGPSVRFIDQVAAPRRLQAMSAVGELFPLHCTANGKALLAAMPAARAEALLPEKLERLTPNTVVSREELLRELEVIRRDGVAFDREEHTVGIGAAGAAISDGVDIAAAAVSVPVPIQRFRDNEPRIAEVVRQAAGAANGPTAPT
jgi:DNA-binding IclR family transcriptional regulator